MTHAAQSSKSRPWLFVSTAAIGLLVALGGYAYLSRTRIVPKAPTVPVPIVSTCKDLSPGTRRLGAKAGDRYMLQFAVPVTKVRIREGVTDAPPLIYGFDIKPQADESVLMISYGPPTTIGANPAREAHSRVENRIVVNDTGHSVGEDDLSYLNTGTRSRHVLFQGWVTVQYRSVSEEDAELFDEIINSACLLLS